MAFTLLGQDFTPPDLAAKVTGRAKYAEDFRADGMLFCRLLTSTMPHARVKIDASEALAMEGVVAVLTADDVPQAVAPAEPLRLTSPVAKSDTDSLNTTVNRIGETSSGSGCAAAWLIVTLGGVASHATDADPGDARFVLVAASAATPASIEATTLPAVVMPVTATL